MKEKEEKGERSLNKLALEKRRKTRKGVMETETRSYFFCFKKKEKKPHALNNRVTLVMK